MNKFYFKLLFSILLFTLLFLIVDIDQLYSTLSQLTLEVFLYLMLISFLLVYISALKWQLFLESQDYKVSVFKLFGLYLSGYFINTFAPSYLGGDSLRSYAIGKESGQHQAFTATILERYTGFVAMISLSFFFVFFIDININIKLFIFLITFATVVITYIALSNKLLDFLRRFPFLKRFIQHIEKIQSGLILAKKDKKLLLKGMLYSYFFHSITVINTLACAYAIGWFDAPVIDIFVVLPLILLIGAIPLAPSGLGIQEGAFYYFLSGLGATASVALGVGLLLRAKALVLAVLGGIFLFFYKDK